MADDRMVLAEAMDLHRQAVREAYRRVLRCRSDLDAAQYEHQSAQERFERFKKYVTDKDNGHD